MFLNYQPLKNLLIADIERFFGLESRRVVVREHQKHPLTNEGEVYFWSLRESWM